MLRPVDDGAFFDVEATLARHAHAARRAAHARRISDVTGEGANAYRTGGAVIAVGYFGIGDNLYAIVQLIRLVRHTPAFDHGLFGLSHKTVHLFNIAQRAATRTSGERESYKTHRNQGKGAHVGVLVL